MTHKLFLFIISLMLLCLLACNQQKWEVDTSKSNLSLEFDRFELDLYAASKNGIEPKEYSLLAKKHPKLLPLFTGGIMHFKSTNDSLTRKQLENFTSNKDIQKLFEEVKNKYPEGSLKTESNKLSNAFIRYQYFFPENTIPALTTMISAFNYSIAADDSLLIIGLDNYLGADFKVYAQTGIPQYKFKQFERKYLVSDALKAWLTTEFEGPGGQNMLQQMIFQGKILYLLNAFLPNTDPSVFFNYTPEELTWCQENESEIWFHFVDMELLYSIENFQVRKYMGDAPFISGFPEGSPGRVGQWVGYQIVSAFMENNTELSLEDLMQKIDANKFLQQSKYKPRR